MVNSVNNKFFIKLNIVFVCFFELFCNWNFMLGYWVSRFDMRLLIMLLVILEGFIKVLFIIVVMVIECFLFIWIIELKFWFIVKVVICWNGIFWLLGVCICMFLRCFMELCLDLG